MVGRSSTRACPRWCQYRQQYDSGLVRIPQVQEGHFNFCTTALLGGKRGDRQMPRAAEYNTNSHLARRPSMRSREWLSVERLDYQPTSTACTAVDYLLAEQRGLVCMMIRFVTGVIVQAAAYMYTRTRCYVTVQCSSSSTVIGERPPPSSFRTI